MRTPPGSIFLAAVANIAANQEDATNFGNALRSVEIPADRDEIFRLGDGRSRNAIKLFLVRGGGGSYGHSSTPPGGSVMEERLAEATLDELLDDPIAQA